MRHPVKYRRGSTPFFKLTDLTQEKGPRGRKKKERSGVEGGAHTGEKGPRRHHRLSLLSILKAAKRSKKSRGGGRWRKKSLSPQGPEFNVRMVEVDTFSP